MSIDIEEKWIYWLAGLVDGEGYIGINKSTPQKAQQNPRYSALVRIYNGNRSLLAKVKEVSGVGKVYGPWGKYLREYVWQVSSEDATRFLLAIRHALIVKGRQADCAIAIREFQRRRTRRSLPTDLEHKELLWTRIKSLNQRQVA